MRNATAVLGLLLCLVGAVWAFQGLGVVGGSFMTGQRQWLIIGIVTGLVGVVLMLWSRRRPR